MKRTTKKSQNPVIASGSTGNEYKDSKKYLSKAYAAIDQLHEMDLAALKENNIDMSVKLVTEDCIMLPPALGPIHGHEHIRNYLNEKFMQWRPYKVVRYDQQFEEVIVADGWAYEWGTCQGAYYMKNGGPDIFENSRIFRILRSQPDGSWKIARIMWHDIP